MLGAQASVSSTGLFCGEARPNLESFGAGSGSWAGGRGLEPPARLRRGWFWASRVCSCLLPECSLFSGGIWAPPLAEWGSEGLPAAPPSCPGLLCPGLRVPHEHCPPGTARPGPLAPVPDHQRAPTSLGVQKPGAVVALPGACEPHRVEASCTLRSPKSGRIAGGTPSAEWDVQG